MSDSFNKDAYPRYHVALDISSADYEALTDGLGRAIPFHVNVDEDVTLSVKLADSTTFEDLFFPAGDSAALVIAVETDATVTASLKAEYPYKPATTTINV